jgi:CheY-like chemotaxis protein
MKRLLVVEDEEALRLLYQEEFGREGYEVTAVGDAESALKALEGAPFDLVITDIRMPGPDGIDLMTRILGRRRDLPVIINTAYQSYRDDFMSWAADAYIVKSGSLAELKAKVKELVPA